MPLLVTLIILLVLVFIFVLIVLLKPNWFIFQPTFGMNISTLAMLLTAVATLILATVAFKNIHDNIKQKIFDRKLMLLNEIVEWAKGMKYSFADIVQINKEAKHRRVTSLQLNIFDKIAANNNSMYEYLAEPIASEFGTSLHKSIDKVFDKFTLYSECSSISLFDEAVEEYIHKKRRVRKEIKKAYEQGPKAMNLLLDKYGDQLENSISELIFECGDIKSNLLKS